MRYSNHNMMSCPWIESPFFHSVLKEKVSAGLSEEQAEQAEKFHADGYLMIDLELTDAIIDQLKSDIFSHLDTGKVQDSRYHYSDSPRVFEAWKFSRAVRSIATHPKVLATLEMLYGRKPMPFQTINFIRGSAQPHHSDSLHFHTEPERWLSGAWTALEDMTEDNGTLNFCPGSHKLPVYALHHLNLKPTAYGEQFENYRLYEEFINELIEEKGFTRQKFLGKKGRAILWSSNLLHGGSEVRNPEATRWSQATHYYFEGCNHYYSPLFSDVPAGQYAEKDITNKNIIALAEKDVVE